MAENRSCPDNLDPQSKSMHPGRARPEPGTQVPGHSRVNRTGRVPGHCPARPCPARMRPGPWRGPGRGSCSSRTWPGIACPGRCGLASESPSDLTMPKGPDESNRQCPTRKAHRNRVRPARGRRGRRQREGDVKERRLNTTKQGNGCEICRWGPEGIRLLPARQTPASPPPASPPNCATRLAEELPRPDSSRAGPMAASLALRPLRASLQRPKRPPARKP